MLFHLRQDARIVFTAGQAGASCQLNHHMVSRSGRALCVIHPTAGHDPPWTILHGDLNRFATAVITVMLWCRSWTHSVTRRKHLQAEASFQPVASGGGCEMQHHDGRCFERISVTFAYRASVTSGPRSLSHRQFQIGKRSASPAGLG